MRTMFAAGKHRIIIALVAAAVGFFGGYMSHGGSISFVNHEQREDSHGYAYINPLLACGDDNFSQLPNDRAQELEKKMREYVETKKSTGTVSSSAVYFRALNGGYSIGINENSVFTPGSLLKVPLVMSVYQRVEQEPDFLQQVVLYEGGNVPAVEHYQAPTITPGSQYTVEDLAKATLMYSDNNAAALLTQLISSHELNDSYAHLGIKIPTAGEDYSMSVKVYASFFRILFNATYIDHEASEHLLSVLAHTSFNDGIIAGVPAGTVVAHKFGERSFGDSGEVQLHDCGIVYHPNQPYLICVMMRGKDFSTLASSIADISRLVYSYAE